MQPQTYSKNLPRVSHKKFILKQLFGIQIIYHPFKTKAILLPGGKAVLLYFDIKNKILSDHLLLVDREYPTYLDILMYVIYRVGQYLDFVIFNV